MGPVWPILNLKDASLTTFRGRSHPGHLGPFGDQKVDSEVDSEHEATVEGLDRYSGLS